MADQGVKTTDLGSGGVVVDFLCNVANGTVINTGRVSRESATAQIVAESGLETRIDAIEAGQISGYMAFETWVLLNANPGTAIGDYGVVLSGDTGTHTDPVVGGTVNNAGKYRWSTSPAGWKRIGDLDTELIEEIQATLAKHPLVKNPGVTGYSYSWADKYGRVSVGITETGVLRASYVVLTELFATEYGNSTMRAITLTPPGWSHVWGDSVGRFSVGVTDTGTFHAFDAEITNLNGIPVESIISGDHGSGAAAQPVFDAEISFVISYGQSLSVGSQAFPPLSTTQPQNSLKMNTGVRTQDGAPTEPTSFVSLTETYDGGVLGETPLAGCFQQANELLERENGIVYTARSFQFLGSAPGAGGTPIDGLDKGTSIYTRYIDDVTDAYAIASAQNKPLQVGSVLWTQGSSDYDDDTVSATYVSKLETLISDTNTDIKAIVPGQPDIPFICGQSDDHGQFGHAGDPYIALAQLALSKTNPLFHIGMPMYVFPRVGDAVHMTATGSKWCGAYYGIAHKRIVIDKQEWSPLDCIAAYRQGNTVFARFHVPYGKLVFDTSTVAAQTNYGFTLVDSGGTPFTISSVEITTPTTIKIVASSTVTAGSKLRAGFDRYTNVRDTQGDSIIFDPTGINKPMHNWLVIFERTLT